VKPLSKVLVKIGIERHGRKASRTGRGPPIYRGRRQHGRTIGSPPSTRPARSSTQLLGLPRLEASYVVVKIGIERRGRQPSGTGRGPPVYRGRRPTAFRALCSPPSTRPDRCCTQPLSLPRLGTSFKEASRLGSSDTVERRAERVEVRQFIKVAAGMPSAWLTTFTATRSVLYATSATAEA
jgi:hypothetical protein